MEGISGVQALLCFLIQCAWLTELFMHVAVYRCEDISLGVTANPNTALTGNLQLQLCVELCCRIVFLVPLEALSSYPGRKRGNISKKASVGSNTPWPE